MTEIRKESYRDGLLSLPKAVTPQYSSSYCGDPKQKVIFIATSITVILLQIWLQCEYLGRRQWFGKGVVTIG